MTYLIEDINECTSMLYEADEDLIKFVSKQLSCYMQGYQFMPAYRAGLTDGKKHFYKIMGVNIVFPKGLSTLLCVLLEKKGYKITHKKMQYPDILPNNTEFNNFVDSLALPFKPFDYQYSSAFDSIVNYRQINKLATGSGKSLIQYALTRYFISKGLRVVILVPRIMLVEQMYADFQQYGWKDIDDFAVKIGGDNKVQSFDSILTLSTWQSLMNRASIFRDVDVLIVDEVHGAAGSSTDENVYEKIIFSASEGARYRLGFTGTVPDNAVSKMSLMASIGPVKTYITTRQLIDRGLATPVIIKFLFFNYTMDNRKIVKRLKYPDEVKYFNNHIHRNNVLAKVINKVSEEGNTIVLVDNVDYGETLAEQLLLLRGITAEVKELKKADNPYKIYIINGSTKGKEREKIRNLLENDNNNILIGTSSILSTGVNIKNLHNLFLTSGGKSFIQINQAIGRLLRTHISKSLVKIWDIVDDCTIKNRSSTSKNYRYKQWEERMSIYREHDYDYTEKEIQIKGM